MDQVDYIKEQNDYINSSKNRINFAETLNDMASRLKANASAIKDEGFTDELLKNVLSISKYISIGVERKMFVDKYTSDYLLPTNEDKQTIYYEDRASSKPKKMGSNNNEDFM